MRFEAEISGRILSFECDADLADQGRWLLEVLAGVEAQRGKGFIQDGARIALGWSILTIKASEAGLIVTEPDFSSDPFTCVREDVSLTLGIQAVQNDFCALLGVEPAQICFQDKIIFATGCLTESKVFLERKPSEQGDSGWYIGPAGDNEGEAELEACYVYQLLDFRPALLKILQLPVGYLVVVDGDDIEAVIDPHGEQMVLQ